MARKVQYTDNAEALLTTAINNSDDPATFSITAGYGAKFPPLSAGQWFPVTVVDSSENYEHMKCTARSTDALTCDREPTGWGQTKRAFAVGDAVYLGWIKPMVDEILFKEEAQEGQPHYLGVAGGTANALTFSATPTLVAYVAGQAFTFEAASNNTGAATGNIDGLGAKAIVDLSGNALVSGAIVAGGHYWVQYDGTDLVLMNGPQSVVGVLTVGDLEVTGDLTLVSANVDVLPAGMEIEMFQVTIPTGWTLSTADNDRVPIVRSTNTVAGTQGGSWTLSGLTMPHTHTQQGSFTTGAPSAGIGDDNETPATTATVAHTHSVTISGATSAASSSTVSSSGAWRPAYVYTWVGVKA